MEEIGEVNETLIHNIESIKVLGASIVSGNLQLPLTIDHGLSGMTKARLAFVIPVAFAVTIPAQSLTGRLDAGWVVGTFAAAIGFVIISRAFWRFGLKHYTGASA